MRVHTGVCPICGDPATTTDWQPNLDWVVVEGCRCDGFFVQGVLRERLFRLTPDEREELGWRIRRFRSMRHEAWVTTLDGSTRGPLVVRTERPDRPGKPTLHPNTSSSFD
jgi:hypothetical protein